MTELDCKILTEQIGECWHSNETWYDCDTAQHCKRRTFDNPDDFFVLWDWAKKQNWWKDFLHAANECAMTNDIKEQGIAGKYYIINTKWFPEMILIFGKKKLGWIMTDNEARLLTQVADMTEEMDALRKKLAAAEETIKKMARCDNHGLSEGL